MRLLNWLRSLLLRYEVSHMDRKILRTLQANAYPIPEQRKSPE